MSPSPTISRPAPEEHAPYYVTYINAAARALETQGDDDVIKLLASQTAELRALLAGRDASIAQFAYAAGKWTLGESLVHVSDAERVFSYRLLRVARRDQTPLPGFDQDPWVPNSRAQARTLADILDEGEAVRHSTLALVRSLDAGAIGATGTASGAAVSARALIWIIAGHFAHHLGLIRDRYLATPTNG